MLNHAHGQVSKGRADHSHNCDGQTVFVDKERWPAPGRGGGAWEGGGGGGGGASAVRITGRRLMLERRLKGSPCTHS